MSERLRKGEQAKYRESALGLVEFALKKPARKRTLLEREISETPLIGQTSLFKAATVSREKDIQAMEKEGKGDVAKIMREEMRDIGKTKVDDAGDIAWARKRAREAGGKRWVRRVRRSGHGITGRVRRLLGLTQFLRPRSRQAHCRRPIMAGWCPGPRTGQSLAPG
jgi:hypothetical protein